MNTHDYTEEERKPDPDLGKWKNFLRFMWNPKKKTFMSRTVRNWGSLIIFYSIFLSVLMGILSLMVWITMLNINRYDTPWWQQEYSRIGASPGLGFRPVLHLKSPLIWYKWNNYELGYKDYVKEVDKFLARYEYSDNKYENCGDASTSFPRHKPCYFNVSQLQSCAVGAYGYDELAPCIYIKLNKIYGWVPDCYKDTTSLPHKMPAYLRNLIVEHYSSNKEEMNTVWVSCEGYFPADTEHMGDIKFYPRPGFRVGYFPFLGQKQYLSPLVAVKFQNPMRDILISVRCRVWARNIDDDLQSGSPVDFQLMIGEKH